MKEEISDYSQLDKIISDNTAVILYFYSDNCAPCVQLRPKVQELVEGDYPEIKLYLIDAESNPEIPAKYGVFSNPTIILFFDGKEYRRESKYISIPQLSETISRPYNMLFDAE